jgi:AraC-like DNA-binding protein
LQNPKKCESRANAASLLQDRSLKLQSVAEAVGYQDPFAFSRAFKRWSGASPSAYRARY